MVTDKGTALNPQSSAHSANTTAYEIEIRLQKLSKLLNSESGKILAGYGFTQEDLLPVNRRSYFTTLAELNVFTNKVILDYCSKQFSNCTSLEGVRFFVKNRLILAKFQMRLKIAGIRYFYLRNESAAEAGLKVLDAICKLIVPFQPSGSPS